MFRNSNTRPLAVGKMERISQNNNSFLPKILPSSEKTVDWFRIGVTGDGSCFFHSLAAAINHQNYRKHKAASQAAIGRNLRREIQRTITEKQWNAFWKKHNVLTNAPTADEARFQIGNTKIWANMWQIFWTMHVLRLNCVFYDFSNRGTPYCGITIEKSTYGIKHDNKELPNLNWKLCCIAWISHSHFEPIALMGGLKKEDNSNITENKQIKTLFSGKVADKIIEKYAMNASCSNIKIENIAKQNKK